MPALFWLGLILLIVLVIAERRPKLVVPALLIGLALSLAPIHIFRLEYRDELARQETKAIAALSLQLGGMDWSLLRSLVMRTRDEFEAILPTVKAMSHVPFNVHSSCPALGAAIQIKEGENRLVVLDAARTAGSGLRYVGGRARPAIPWRADCYLLVDGASVVRGRVIRLPERRWGGYIQQGSFGEVAIVLWPSGERIGAVQVPERKG